jgi:hypothetical protein
MDSVSAIGLEHFATTWVATIDMERSVLNDDCPQELQREIWDDAIEHRELLRRYMHDFGIVPLSRKQLGVSKLGYRELDDLLSKIEEPGGLSLAGA